MQNHLDKYLDIQKELSENRQRLGEIGLIPESDLTTEQRAEQLKLRQRQPVVEAELQKAFAEQRSEQKKGLTLDTEDRERRELRERAQVSAHIAAAMQGRTLDGAELEYNQSIGLKSAGAFPLDLLSPTVETRAVTTEDTAVQSRPWLDRLFADTAAMRLGITFESVPAGVANFPVITAGGTPAQRGKGQDAADAAWDCWSPLI